MAQDVQHRPRRIYAVGAVVEHAVTIGGESVPIFDVMGKDSVLFHRTTSDDETSDGPQYVDQARRWFESVWSTIATEANMNASVGRLLAEAGALLLDFDGPICSVYATVPDHVAADQVRAVLERTGMSLPETVKSTSDPLEVLQHAAGIEDRVLIEQADQALIRAELIAIEGAEPTPGAHETIRAAAKAGVSVAIVSNNSMPAIEAYLTRYELTDYVQAIVGRVHGRPDLMKPNPHPLTVAAAELDTRTDACLLVGDSTTDMIAAHAAGTRSIGFANRPGKAEALRQAGADAVVGPNGMLDIADGLGYRG